jgi:hypothetical protein
VSSGNRSPDSDSDDIEFQDLLRYSVGEQVNILHGWCKKLQAKHERDQNRIKDMEKALEERSEWCDHEVREKEFFLHERDRVVQECDQLLNDREELHSRFEQEKMRLQNRANEAGTMSL